MERRGRQNWEEAPKDGEAVAMETKRGPGKEKAKGQLGNFLKGVENPSECVPFTGQLLLSEAGTQASMGARARGLPAPPGGRGRGLV